MHNDKDMTRRDFGKGLAAVIAAGVAPSVIGGGMMRNVGARLASFNENGEDEEEKMYKEIYMKMVNNDADLPDVLVDDVSTMLSSNGAFTRQNGGIRKATFNKVTYCGYAAFQYNSFIEEINLPVCTQASTWAFQSASKLKILRLPSISYLLGNLALGNTSSLTDVYLTSMPLSANPNYPFGCTNPNTVFHMADGDFDYQKNPITA